MSVLSSFYRWAEAEGHAGAVPFSYAQAQARFAGSVGGASVNLARRRVPKRHVTIKYLEPGFADLFVRALAGLGPDGTADAGYRGRELARNSAVARLALATGLRRQEFTFLLACELPPLPGPGPGRSGLPIPFGVPAGVTKGGKFRTTWVDYPRWRRPTAMPASIGRRAWQGIGVESLGPLGAAAGGDRARCRRRPGERGPGAVGVVAAR